MFKKHISLFCGFFLLSWTGCAQPNLEQLDEDLAMGRTTPGAILSDPSLMHLHAQTPFRELIKKHAQRGKFTMVTAQEPGTRITIKGVIRDARGQALPDALLYVYQTSGKGWYSDTAAHIQINSGDYKHARLFAYFKTDRSGGFEYETIKPKGYPDSDLPAHIHIGIWKDNKPVPGMPGELLFDDDERLTPDRKKRALADGYLVSKNSGTVEQPVYFYDIWGKGG